MWRHLCPDGAEQPVGYVTNGVHTATWVGPEMRTFYAQHLDPDWEQRLLEPEFWKQVREAPDAALWAAHRAQKERLIRFVRERVRVQSARHGLRPDELRQVEALLDPHALTIGFARRFATYKRAFLILSDLDRLRALVSDPARPVQLLFAGKAHPADREGQEVIRRLFSLTHGEFRGKLVFLEDYDIEIGRAARAGLRRLAQHPAPAAGGERHQRAEGARSTAGSTSASSTAGGRRASAATTAGRSATAASTPTPRPRTTPTPSRSTGLLEDEVVPALLRPRRGGPAPRSGSATMKASIESVVPPFSAHRMVRDYVVGQLPPRRGVRGS